MALEMNSKFNILQQSPHDLSPKLCMTGEEASQQDGKEVLAPSRYNVHAISDDGRLVIWNSFSGSMSVFPNKKKDAVKSLLKGRNGSNLKVEGLVKYLFDRGFLVNAGSNEYRQVQTALSQQHYRNDILELILLSSEDCNFRCKYCYEDFARGTMLPEVREGIKNLVTERARRLGKLHVSWFGGEPLYGMETLEDLCPFFIEQVERYDLHFFSHMTTNGYLLTPETVEKLFRWKIMHYQVTIDGMPDNHNESRPTRDGGETFKRIFENLIHMKSRPEEFSVVIRVNFDKKNYPHFEDFLDLLEKNLGDDTRFALRFHAVGKWDGPNDSQLEVCGLDESEEVSRRMREEARKRGLVITTLKDVNRLGGEICYAARPYNFIIGATGKLMKCTIVLDRKDYNVVGHITREGELVLDDERFAMWTEAAFEGDKRCQKCTVLPLCGGTHCPDIRIIQNKAPCITTRMKGKSQLLEMLDYQHTNRRSVRV